MDGSKLIAPNPIRQKLIHSMWVQGSARVIRCLQEQREELSYECRATLFDAEVRMAEDIDFKYPMKRACSNELTQLCPGIPHGSARLIRCLQEHQDDDAMSSECKEEVTSDMIRSNQDYRRATPAVTWLLRVLGLVKP